MGEFFGGGVGGIGDLLFKLVLGRFAVFKGGPEDFFNEEDRIGKPLG